MANTIQIQKKKRSKTLDDLLENLNPDFDKLQPKVDAVFEQGRKEGFCDMEIGDFVRSNMKVNYSLRTIQRVLPDTAKHIEHTGNHKTSDEPDKMSGSEREKEPIELPGNHKTSDEPDKMSGSEREKEPIELPGDKVKVSKRLPNVEERTVEGIDNDFYITPPPSPAAQQKQEENAAPTPASQPSSESSSTTSQLVSKIKYVPYREENNKIEYFDADKVKSITTLRKMAKYYKARYEWDEDQILKLENREHIEHCTYVDIKDLPKDWDLDKEAVPIIIQIAPCDTETTEGYTCVVEVSLDYEQIQRMRRGKKDPRIEKMASEATQEALGDLT
jgi:hypothetical protein